MKNLTILFCFGTVYFFAIISTNAQTKIDTAKVKPSFEYSILTLRTEFIPGKYDIHSHYNLSIDIDYENGLKENFYNKNNYFELPYLYQLDSIIFKAFEYLGTFRYDLVSSRGNYDSNGIQYIFRRKKE